MQFRLTERIKNTPTSFICEVLKITADPNITSFAAGMPNPEFFPIKELNEAANTVLSTRGEVALQYSTTEGHPELRAYIANRYAKVGINVHPDQVLITTGSTQGLDLVAKMFLEKGDEVILELPSYLGMIQVFSMFEPRFVTVELQEDGPNLEQVERLLATKKPKLFYAVPNFQNPSGRTYGRAKREALSKLLKSYPDTIFIEDDPYGELRFSGEHLPSLYSLVDGRSILLGSFSKIISPGLRLGWMIAPLELITLAVKAKQAADMHTSTFDQMLIMEYLKHHDINEHIKSIIKSYGLQASTMIKALEREVPKGVIYTKPEGGMFTWLTLPNSSMPKGLTCLDLFDLSVKEQKVAFLPGMPFYCDGTGQNTLRLNFTNTSIEAIDDGITRLCKCMKGFLKN